MKFTWRKLYFNWHNKQAHLLHLYLDNHKPYILPETNDIVRQYTKNKQFSWKQDGVSGTFNYWL